MAPVGDRVLVKVDVSEAKSTGGILLPTSAQKKPTQGEITSVGSAKAVKACTLAHMGCSSAVPAPPGSNRIVAPNTVPVRACGVSVALPLLHRYTVEMVFGRLLLRSCLGVAER